MKSEDGNPGNLCPCSKQSTDTPPGFVKIVDLNKIGLVIYRHSLKTKNTSAFNEENQPAAVEDTRSTKNTATTEDVFIVLNKKDADITSTDFLPEMEKRGTCLRCNHIMEHALKLLLKVRAINRHAIMGICDHCKLKDQSCYKCDDIIKKFFQSVNASQDFKSTKESLREWLSKVKNVLKDSGLEEKVQTIYERKRLHSDVRLEQFHPQYARSEHQSNISELIRESKNPSLTRTSSAITEKSKEQYFLRWNHLEPSESPMKHREDLSEPKTSVSILTLSPKEYEETQLIPEHHNKTKSDLQPPFRTFVPEDDIKPAGYPKQYTHVKKDLISDKKAIGETYTQDRKTTLGQSGGSDNKQLKICTPNFDEEYEEIDFFKNIICKVTDFPMSEKETFTYSFPKKLEVEKQMKRLKSSTELIKDTHEMIRAKTERKKRSIEEEQLKKTEGKEKKSVAREERAKLVTETIKLAEEMAKDTDETKKEKLVITASTDTTKNKEPKSKFETQEPSVKSDSKGLKPELKKSTLKARESRTDTKGSKSTLRGPKLGSKDPKDGTKELKGGIKKPKDGLKEPKGERKEFKEVSKDSKGGKTEPKDGLKELKDGPKDLKHGLKELKVGPKELKNESKGVPKDPKEILKAPKDGSSKEPKVGQKESKDESQGGPKEPKDALKEPKDGSKELKVGQKEYKDELKGGPKEPKDVLKEPKDEVKELKNGLKDFKDAPKEPKSGSKQQKGGQEESRFRTTQRELKEAKQLEIGPTEPRLRTKELKSEHGKLQSKSKVSKEELKDSESRTTASMLDLKKTKPDKSKFKEPKLAKSEPKGFTPKTKELVEKSKESKSMPHDSKLDKNILKEHDSEKEINKLNEKIFINQLKQHKSEQPYNEIETQLSKEVPKTKNVPFLEENRIPRRVLEAEKAKKTDKPDLDGKEKQKKAIKKLHSHDEITHYDMLRSSQNDVILDLVKFKRGTKKKALSQRMTPSEILRHERQHKHIKGEKCPMCNNSDLELDYESKKKIINPKELQEIIHGKKISKYNQYVLQKMNLKDEENEFKGVVKPLLFTSMFDGTSPNRVSKLPAKVDTANPPPPSETMADQEPNKGVINYALSDRTFIEKGWTMLPTEKVVRKMNVYRMRPAHPEFDWFKRHKNKRIMHYDTGERLAEFDENGRGRWYYKNERMALEYYDAEELNAQQRFVIYSNGEPDERGRPRPYTILATFDYLGNGIVFDHSGKIRLKYNQTEGVVLDRNIGPVSHWKWHTLNDPPVLQQVMIDTQMAHKDPRIFKMGGPAEKTVRPDNEEMLAIEFDNFIKEKSKKLTQTFKPFQIKMKALKINEHFSLKVLDQANVYLIYRDGTTNIKLNIGMLLDNKEIVDTDTAEVGEVSNNVERFPARTDSIAGLQKSIAHAQRFEQARQMRESNLRPPQPCASADRLTAAASRPNRFLQTVRSSMSTTTANCSCQSKKASCNLYYDNRLF